MTLLPDEQARIDKILNCASGNLHTVYREVQWLCEFVKAQEQLIDELKEKLDDLKDRLRHQLDID